ncbi:HlyD family type I secretion periplasmic adaptor subunit [Falsirhodobacter sp. 20TX0035]|uniref:HlyD family type I secretion periplasmic adaptor subunit n=1 Tax=Falsirhodobacter sp. 20TX0035 TaxID=3022019 RepID=UPI00232B1F44|nr:HlyD family type I secretion periplasmic adaptor subunit [Falsirhodobacter sp. 20TX0035]MDB6454007.1 HlyD family type I secretion periplasmic adaptor subunit [Falsirhodobacter sp. 20TX0035]
MNFGIKGQVIAGGVALAVLVGGFGSWSVLARVDGAVIAAASLQVPGNRRAVQHPDGGVVAAVQVAEGQVVRAGEVLLRLDGSALRSELAIVEGQVFEVTARHARLAAERDGRATIAFPPDLPADRPEVALQMDGQRTLFAARAATLTAQQDQLRQREAQVRSQIDGLNAQATANATQLRLAEEELADERLLLSKGLTQRAQVRALERESARLQGQAGALVADLAEAGDRITEYRMQALSLVAERREEAITQLRDFSYQLAELSERRAALRQQIDRLDMRAPVGGRVLGLTVTTPGAVIRAADAVLWIVPQDEPLLAEARIPPVNIDEVREGQSVRLTLPAFPGRTAPEVEGVVQQVSADTLQDKEGASFYVARIALTAPPGLVLTPGMPADAFIRTGARSPLGYLLHPFTSYFDRAFRES